MFNSKIGIGVLKHPGYNGKGSSGGGGQSTSTSTPVDFFGKDARAPYEAELQNLLLGGGPSVDYIKSQPGFQLGSEMGQEGLERRFRATGVGPSGYENLAINNFQNQYTGDYLQRQIANLATISGAGLIANATTSSSTGPSQAPGIFGTVLGAGIGMMSGNPFAVKGINPTSDRNLKTNIKHINTINGIKIYSFNYIWSYIKSVGVMAQDLLEMPKYKHAVHTTNIGYVVDYSKLPI
tara:strand:- start:2261 stop:2971 length:711 start_codon:yes stop_codon:yes gene_type:complete